MAVDIAGGLRLPRRSTPNAGERPNARILNMLVPRFRQEEDHGERPLSASGLRSPITRSH